MSRGDTGDAVLLVALIKNAESRSIQIIKFHNELNFIWKWRFWNFSSSIITKNKSQTISRFCPKVNSKYEGDIKMAFSLFWKRGPEIPEVLHIKEPRIFYVAAIWYSLFYSFTGVLTYICHVFVENRTFCRSEWHIDT